MTQALSGLRPSPLRLALVAGPAVLIAALGLLHPIFLTPETADRWQLAHYLLLPAFPLLAVSIWLLLRGQPGPVAWAARVLALGYAVLYTALDAIAGVGAPQQVRSASAQGAPEPPIGALYEVGDRLGQLGVLALALAGVLTAALLAGRRSGPAPAVLGGALLLVGCYLFYRHHVFPPYGVSGQLLLAAGLALLALVPRPAPY